MIDILKNILADNSNLNYIVEIKIADKVQIQLAIAGCYFELCAVLKTTCRLFSIIKTKTSTVSQEGKEDLKFSFTPILPFFHPAPVTENQYSAASPSKNLTASGKPKVRCLECGSGVFRGFLSRASPFSEDLGESGCHSVHQLCLPPLQYNLGLSPHLG